MRLLYTWDFFAVGKKTITRLDQILPILGNVNHWDVFFFGYFIFVLTWCSECSLLRRRSVVTRKFTLPTPPMQQNCHAENFSISHELFRLASAKDPRSKQLHNITWIPCSGYLPDFQNCDVIYLENGGVIEMVLYLKDGSSLSKVVRIKSPAMSFCKKLCISTGSTWTLFFKK